MSRCVGRGGENIRSEHVRMKKREKGTLKLHNGFPSGMGCLGSDLEMASFPSLLLI